MYRGDGSMRQTGSRRERGATDETPPAGELLRQAVGYALGCAQFVTPALLHRPTPCAAWDLGTLLAHADDSLAALHEGFAGGSVAVAPGPRPRPADPAAAFRVRASRLLGSWTATGGPPHRVIAIADSPLTAEALALTGALDLTVHGWDIARAVRHTDRPVPPGLAEALLPVSRHLVPYPEVRPPLFAPEIPAPPEAGPGDRLVAFLGRDPDW
ncbi:maleylpyruvate isomerase family mycothiol-dependent enzyme [Streptomyces albiaxialis]|uniref:Maleylpyruvate isomerase family mycothiol-dependent enzyme n=1 Tax=Streptomyces albiaxialis TaxID=329523 RepID=A0ABN2VDI5_9ACTN